MMLLAGYQDAATPAHRKVFAMKDGNGYYAEWWDWDRFSKWVGGQQGWPLFRHSGRVESKPAKETALRVMGDLVALSAGVPQDIRNANPKATFGLAGIEAWAADCADVEKHEDWGMCHPENPQWTVRNSTAVYLENVAKQALLSPDATAHVRKAAAQYRSAYAAWQQAYAQIGYAAPEGSGKVKERRLAAAAAVRRAAEFEKAGIAEIAAALQAEGVEVQPTSAAAGAAGEVVLSIPGMPEDMLDKGLADRGCSYQAGVARAYVWALRQAGVDIDFTEFTALSGWAFSFVYNYGNCPQVGIRVRGTAGEAGPGETFQIADWFGLGYESAPTQDREKFWAFVREQINAGHPIISEHGDGGLILGYREHGGKREARFVSFMGGRWMDINGFEPFEVCALVPKGQALTKRDLYLKGLQRAVHYETMPEWKGAATGLAGLDVYAADAADPAKDFADHSDWFCWATFNRIDTRVCAADWLRDAADVLGGDARRPLLAAADQYARAFKSYTEFQAGLGGGDDSAEAFLERIRKPEKVAALAPLLKSAVEAERAGVAQLQAGLRALGEPVPAVTATVAAAAPNREDGKVWLDGLKWFPSWMTLPGCLVACSRYLRADNSPDWVYGATAFAFALNVHRTLCPSGPTAWGDGDCTGLARNMGMRVEGLFVGKDDANFAQKQEEFFGRVCRAIDAGLPVIGWEMAEPDYYVVHGYDAEGNYLFRNFDDTVGRTSKTKLGDTGIGVFSLMIVHPQAPADDRTTVRQALALALDIAAGKPHHGGEYAMGIAGYDRWIKALAEPEAVLADENAAYGLAYNAACWEDCRSHAPGFLQEAQKRLADPNLDIDFAAAIASYREAAAGVKKVKDLFPFDHAQKAGMTERLRDAALRAQAVEALRSARAAEAEGLRSLAALVEKLGGPRVDVAAVVGPRRVMLENVPPVGGEGNGYVRGIEVLLAGAGAPVAYDRLMGLSGMAFIAQADTGHRWEGKVDVGWWPLDMWGLEMRRDFLARAVGWELQEAGLQTMDLTEEQVKAASADLPQFYRDHLEQHVRASIDAGRPVLGNDDFGFVITGYDDATDAPPVFGRCPRLADSEIGRAESWPCGLIMLGTRTEPMGTEAADIAALQ